MCSKSKKNKIQTLSNKLLKYLLRLDQRTPTDVLHKDLDILKLDDMIKLEILNFVKKCLFENCPDLFKNYFRYQNHTYTIRDPKLYVNPSKTNMGSHSLKIKGASLWNSLSSEIKSKAHLKSFKKVLKTHYLSMYG